MQNEVKQIEINSNYYIVDSIYKDHQWPIDIQTIHGGKIQMNTSMISPYLFA